MSAICGSFEGYLPAKLVLTFFRGLVAMPSVTNNLVSEQSLSDRLSGISYRIGVGKYSLSWRTA